ncbi:MAG: response regulator transcription factor [Lachnospiraceae bacterium]|nr:response regulator transcription factor [Lachnospiraceae bacterium]
MDNYVLLIAPNGEEENSVAGTLSIELEDAGFPVRRSTSFRESDRPALVLLSSGSDRAQSVYEHIRRKQIPVFCYGREAPWARNFFPRPVNIAALIKALRDFGPGETETKLPEPEPAGLFFDPDSRYVSFRGRSLDLTEKEYGILKRLRDNAGRPVTKEELKETVFPEAGEGNIVEVYVNYLRKKLDLRFDVRLIRTVRGCGYLLETEKKGESDGTD